MRGFKIGLEVNVFMVLSIMSAKRIVNAIDRLIIS